MRPRGPTTMPVCTPCAKAKGCTWLEGHIASVWIWPCGFCGKQVEVCAKSDWKWPIQPEETKQ